MGRKSTELSLVGKLPSHITAAKPVHKAAWATQRVTSQEKVFCAHLTILLRLAYSTAYLAALVLHAAALRAPTQSFHRSSCNPPFFSLFFISFFFLVHFLPFPCVWLSGKGGVKEEAAGGKLLISCTVPAAMKVGMFTVIYYSYDLVNEFSINAASTCFLSCLVSCHNMPEKEEYHK